MRRVGQAEPGLRRLAADVGDRHDDPGEHDPERVQPPEGVSYLHILFDQHEIVQADGAWSESFQPGAQTLNGLGRAQRAEILALFPALVDDLTYPAARLKLKPREARVLLQF